MNLSTRELQRVENDARCGKYDDFLACCGMLAAWVERFGDLEKDEARTLIDAMKLGWRQGGKRAEGCPTCGSNNLSDNPVPPTPPNPPGTKDLAACISNMQAACAQQGSDGVDLATRLPIIVGTLQLGSTLPLPPGLGATMLEVAGFLDTMAKLCNGSIKLSDITSFQKLCDGWTTMIGHLDALKTAVPSVAAAFDSTIQHPVFLALDTCCHALFGTTPRQPKAPLALSPQVIAALSPFGRTS